MQTPALNATQLQQVPVHLQVQGSWAAWLAWFELSNPRVVTADQAKTVIEQGTELPYQVAAASGATTLAFRKANLKLEVTPQITPEGGIVFDLDISKDNVGQITPAGFAIDTKHVKTQVLVEDGGTVMIGCYLLTASFTIENLASRCLGSTSPLLI